MEPCCLNKIVSMADVAMAWKATMTTASSRRCFIVVYCYCFCIVELFIVISRRAMVAIILFVWVLWVCGGHKQAGSKLFCCLNEVAAGTNEEERYHFKYP